MASQIARNILNLPVVITTASRPETVDWTKKMGTTFELHRSLHAPLTVHFFSGATHVLDHRKELKAQVDALELQVPLKYVEPIRMLWPGTL